MFGSMYLHASLKAAALSPVTALRRVAPGFISVHVCKLICSSFAHDTHTHSLSLTPGYADLCVHVELEKVA